MGGFEATQAPGRSLRQAAYLPAGMSIAHAMAPPLSGTARSLPNRSALRVSYGHEK
jgi:hypothetical protein